MLRAGFSERRPPQFSLAGGYSAVLTADVGFDFVSRKNEAICRCIVRGCGFGGGACGGRLSRFLHFLMQSIEARCFDFLHALVFAPRELEFRELLQAAVNSFETRCSCMLIEARARACSR